jgi:hypothetical protein
MVQGPGNKVLSKKNQFLKIMFFVGYFDYALVSPDWARTKYYL